MESDDVIVTPEGVALDYAAAGVASRACAVLIDLAVIFGVAITALNIVVAAAAAASTSAALVVMLVGAFLLLFGYSAVLETVNRGRTLGKAALGLRVVTVEGAPVRFRHAAIRSMLQLVDLHLSLGGIAIAAALFTTRGQRLGDLVAGTVVVRERRSTSALAEHAVVFRQPWGTDALVESLDVSRLRRDELALIRSFLIRAEELRPGPRHSLATRLASQVSVRMGHSIPTDMHPEVWLAVVAVAQQRSTAATAPDGRAQA